MKPLPKFIFFLSVLGAFTLAQGVRPPPSQNDTISPRENYPITCFAPGGSMSFPINIDHCYVALRLILNDPEVMKLKVVSARAMPWVRQSGSCMFVLDALDRFNQQTFMMLRAAYFAAELAHPCIVQQSVPLGGKFLLGLGSFYVGLIGTPYRGAEATRGTLPPGMLEQLRNQTNAVATS
ncbi:MAG: hypothetical protein LQ350_004980 [Teloschistes chrysophthalmus]|nr:MAG: hypothetical protein LQ350_004980 [Niorma chrysophthalma]